MNRKVMLIAMVLLVLITVGSVFAETLKCRDPADGIININFLGNRVSATYSGKSAQTFNVWAELEDGTTQMLTIRFAKTTALQTRQAYSEEARLRIVKIARCDFSAY